MDKKDIDPELLKTMMSIYRNSVNREPYIIKVDSARISTPNNEEIDTQSYEICSACYSFINKTWDHSDWCELYKAEPVSEWLRKGKNEK
jgi:hypothetical protein